MDNMHQEEKKTWKIILQEIIPFFFTLLLYK